MISEWLKVMLEEISRKKAEAEQACVEEQRRADEQRGAEEQKRAENVIKSARCAREKKFGDAE